MAGSGTSPAESARKARAPCSSQLERSAETSAESSGVRDGASPNQNGIVGGAPCASTTRAMPGSIFRICHEVEPSRKMSPAWLSTAKSSLIVPTKLLSGSASTR